MKKIFIFTSHPIYYHIGVYKILAKNKNIDLTVYFYSDVGIKKYFDPQFKIEVDFAKEDILNGYNHYFLKNISKVKNFSFLDFINLEIPKIIFKEKPDYVWINSWSYFSDWLVIFSTILSRSKLLIRSENPLVHEFKKPKRKIFIKKILLGFLFRHTYKFLYIGNQNKDFLKFYGAKEEKMIFTPYAVDNDFFQKQKEIFMPKRENLRRNFGIDKEDIVILFTGKLSYKKRPLDLLSAYKNLIKEIKNQNVWLIFVGDGELKKEIEEIIQKENLNKVILAGFQNQKEISKYYIIADIFVLPSGVGETWGLVVNEAMNFGLPIITSDLVGSSYDLVGQGENGYIFKCGDIDELTKYLIELISDSGKRALFCRNSLRIVREYNFSKSEKNIILNLK